MGYNKSSLMPQKSSNNSKRSRTARPGRPIQDIVASKQASQFPSVGMTLNNNQYQTGGRSRFAQKKLVKKSRWQRLKDRITLKRTVIAMGILTLLIGAWVGGTFLYNTQKLFGGNIFDVLKNTKLKGENEGRVNILLAGNSSDDPGHSGGELTDSIMLISIDTKNNRAFMLSIPRDLWVEIPDYGHDKINGAYNIGQVEGFSASGYPKGGMGQLQQIVSENFGLKIHYYSLVNYNALRQAVNAVGGIDVTVKSEDPRGLYDPNKDWSTGKPLVKLSNGKHRLNGQEALNLARARGDSYYSYGYAGSDFTRTQHQRQILLALKNKATSTSTLANPAKLTSLSNAIGGNVKTDFKIDEVKRLYELTKKIESRNIKSLSLDKVNGKSLLASYRTPLGQSALIPAAGLDDFSEIQRYIKKQTSNNKVVQESASIVVLNGTETTGLASNIRNRLLAKSIIVDEVGDAIDVGHTATQIIDASDGSKTATKSELAKMFGSKKVTTTNPYANLYDADFIVVVGSDQAKSATAQSTGSISQ